MKERTREALKLMVAAVLLWMERRGYNLPPHLKMRKVIYNSLKQGRDLMNRDELEKRLARKLTGVQEAWMARLLEQMGDPPSLENVPSIFWEEMGGELASAIVPLLQRTYLDMAADALEQNPQFGLDWALVNQRAVNWAREYTFKLVKGINDTTMSGLRDAISTFLETEGFTRGDLEALIKPMFDPVRAEMISVTEVTRAAAESQVDIKKELAEQGIDMVLVWNTNNDEIVRECPICWPLHNTPQGDDWTDPPPAHPRCRCWVSLELPSGH